MIFKIMGILNVTPDSFSDGGAFFDTSSAVDHALKMAEEGADIIDVGGESSRPGSDPIPVEEEIKRVMPVIEGIRKQMSVRPELVEGRTLIDQKLHGSWFDKLTMNGRPLISIDTTKAAVASRAIDAGANMINDISAGRSDPEMFDVAAVSRVPICLMHMKGKPKTMQQNPAYEDLVGEILSFLSDACSRAEKAGVAPDKIVIDPGIGFGKKAEDNITIIKELSKLKVLGKTILIGSSRKSFIGKLLGLDVDKRLEATLATLSVAYQNGVSIFRVHDVGSARRYLAMFQLINSSPL